ncbi:hypothetical protein PF005_g27729 [Phytophthora fragariae]|uniref:Uncharacterized protein n=1 Tax=Phytophthora fragariae TaxID=53985 RepID=A0A6A3HP81_9STRA|nr:hypothetical protein PF003_g4 [Phytophthora fragariae]KAE8918332.1 hypothetical protein PF009_g31352 [Phytophthora fragariae]KAE8969618.1 hypothetical protein PF011_g26736 [Phytophthora fragariae]KAE9058121.1 hypothetical protein PF010_g31119 [Phytophthora fragariae]KAE9165469.1 hypothetical protein PF002_g31356 [Phytophthora fragariae]
MIDVLKSLTALCTLATCRFSSSGSWSAHHPYLSPGDSRNSTGPSGSGADGNLG